MWIQRALRGKIKNPFQGSKAEGEILYKNKNKKKIAVVGILQLDLLLGL